MIFLFPYVVLFSFFLFLRLLLAISCSRWLMIWIFLELNILIVVPLMVFGKKVEETESRIKYFFAQVIGRIMILLGAFGIKSEFFFVLGILIKLGVVPLHFWVPSVLSGLSWDLCFVLLTFQKLPLLVLLLYLDRGWFELLVLVRVLSAVLGGIMGMNQTYLRALLAYSSIRHIGWLVALSVISRVFMWFYFFIYCIIILGVINYLKKFGSISFVRKFWGPWSIGLILFLFSLGGLPPFSGFASKLIALLCLREVSMVWGFFLIIGSLFGLYYYLCLAFFFIYQDVRFPCLEVKGIGMFDSLILLRRRGLFFFLILLAYSFS